MYHEVSLIYQAITQVGLQSSSPRERKFGIMTASNEEKKPKFKKETKGDVSKNYAR